jgi:Ca2+-binding EF-hand superfamily protein
MSTTPELSTSQVASKVTLEFLLATVNHKKLLSNERLSQVFKMFDKDGNGSISRQEIKEFFSMQDSSEDFVHDLIKEVDENGDGEVRSRDRRSSSPSSKT